MHRNKCFKARHVCDDGSFLRKQPCPASAGQRSGVLLSGWGGFQVAGGPAGRGRLDGQGERRGLRIVTGNTYSRSSSRPLSRSAPCRSLGISGGSKPTGAPWRRWRQRPGSRRNGYGRPIIEMVALWHRCLQLKKPDATADMPRRYRMPSRPGEFHPESLTEPDLTLSHHPARAIARRLPPSAESSGSSRSYPVGPCSTAMTRPLCSAGITPLHHYYGAVRPSPAHRYFRPRGWSRLRLSLGIAGQVLTFRTRARLSFAPSTCRMPLGQSQDIPQADPGGRVTPRF
jgi:hypothetical protein